MTRFLLLAWLVGAGLVACGPKNLESGVVQLPPRSAASVAPACFERNTTLPGRVLVEGGGVPDEPVLIVSVAVLEPEGREETQRIPVGEDGHFELAVPQGAWRVALALEAETLVAREACELLPGASEARLTAQRRALLHGRIRLGPGQRLLEDESLADAQLGWCAPALRTLVPGTRRESYQGERSFALIAEDGSFVLPQLPVGLELELELDAPFGDLLTRVEPLAPGERRALELELTRGARDGHAWRRVTGQVMDERGQPAEDAEVWLRPGLPGRGGRASPRAVCDEDGRFALDGVPVEGLRIVAGGEHYANDGELELAAGTEDGEGLLLRVGRGVELGGEVLWPDGTRAERALVTFGLREDLAEEGHFRLRGLLPHPDVLVIQANRPGALGHFQQLVVPGVAPSTFVLVETPLHELRVHVTDGRGLPVEASISAWFTGSNLWEDRAVVRREPNAIYRLSLPRGHLRIELSAERFHDRVLDLDLPGPELVEVVLEAARELSGRVLDPEGKPVEGARVRSLAVPMAPDATSGPDGQFQLLSAARPERLIASLGGHAPSAVLELPLEGPSIEGIELRLRASCVLEGTVRGTLDEETTVELAWSGGTQSSTPSPDGFFRLRDLPPGRCELWVTRGALEGPRTVVELVATAPTAVELDAP